MKLNRIKAEAIPKLSASLKSCQVAGLGSVLVEGRNRTVSFQNPY
jgi:hypothetical protein